MMMSRYNSNWGSHDQLQDLRKANMVLHRELDEIKGRTVSMENQIIELTDELYLAHEALRRQMPEHTLSEVNKWRGLATMMSHFDICTSARITCNICAEARRAYVEALTNG
jgi:hypothetical protein